jgi:dipeptidyl aminopeptidase/acylaminoacyl peptidase
MSGGMRLYEAQWDQSGALVWLEGHAGQNKLVVEMPGGDARRDLNREYSVRAKVGYGGGDFTAGGGQAYFVEAASGRIYQQPLDSGLARPITPEFGRSAAPRLSPDGKWLLYVNSYEGQDSLGVANAAGQSWPSRLVSGNDFYMQPAWHPDGQRVAWITWNHPNMPWDGTYLRLGSLAFPENGLPVLTGVSTLAGDENTAIFQPEFSPDGHYLAYASDESGWWQLYLHDLEGETTRQITHEQAEHGLPGWVQGMRTYSFAPDGKSLFFIRNQKGFASLWRAELASGHQERLALPPEYTWLEHISVSPADGQIALVASGGRTPARLIVCQPGGGTRIVGRSDPEDVPAAAYALPQAITWTGMDGGEAYGLYYPPQSEAFEGVGLPPLMVLVHGGPTSQREANFDDEVQFFASRGYAVLQVNHRGSTGYGRAYRNMLRGMWGVYDVQDSVSGARHLAETGQVESSRIVIMGGSAGGFTVLKALEDFPGFFKAGINLYGVSNQFDFVAGGTHKFEERYNDTLLGPFPEAADIYRERSPIFFVDQIKDPIAVFQGEDDNVVPRRHSDEVVKSLERRGVPHVYHVYPGEGHGFSKPETIEHFYTEVEKFLRQYVILT